jgi:hypothetical protein
MNYLEKLDAWLDGDDPGQKPIDILRERGTVVPDPGTLDDAQLSATLWQIIAALGDLGVIIEYTDHLTDRELYQRLIDQVLTEPMFLSDEPNSFEVCDMVGDGGDDENATFLSYYATEEERTDWFKDFPETPLPPRKAKVADRDRLLPGYERAGTRC